jgi:hypothetical protein
MAKKYIVSLTAEERQSLEVIVSTGKRAATTITHARILLKVDSEQASGSWRDQDIKAALDISIRTIERVRRRFVEEGLVLSQEKNDGLQIHKN